MLRWSRMKIAAGFSMRPIISSARSVSVLRIRTSQQCGIAGEPLHTTMASFGISQRRGTKSDLPFGKTIHATPAGCHEVRFLTRPSIMSFSTRDCVAGCGRTMQTNSLHHYGGGTDQEHHMISQPEKKWKPRVYDFVRSMGRWSVSWTNKLSMGTQFCCSKVVILTTQSSDLV